MPRRRYRLFTALAVVMLFMLYHVMQNTRDDLPRSLASDIRAPPDNPVHPHAEHLKDSPANPDQVPIKPQPEVVDAPDVSSKNDEGNKPSQGDSSNAQPAKDHSGQEASVPPKGAGDPIADQAAAASTMKPDTGDRSDKDKAITGDAETGQKDTAKAEDSTVVDSQNDQAEKQITSKKPPNKGKDKGSAKKQGEHWRPVEEHFPVPSGSLISLPTGKAKAIPKIQYKFGTESEAAKTERLQRQKKVRAEIERSWAGYRDHAWMHDELSPVTGGYRDPFCGWAATLVDSLDTLWIAGLKEEFDEAAQAVADIDFTYSEKSSIPVFETTIRYLGGLLAAFDVSGGHDGKYKILLDKAFELAEILMGIFDTPNRMPVLYYSWQPKYASQPHKAGTVGMAELATLSLEFTRLAQLTKEDKYYDAVDRITNALVEFQDAGLSDIPGLFPESFDASGCNKTKPAAGDTISKNTKDKSSSEVTNWAGNPVTPSKPQTEFKKPAPGLDVDAHLVRRASEDEGSSSAELQDRKLHARTPPSYHPDELELDECVPQGLVPTGRWQHPYHMGGGQDSAYEYFSKEYLLLGGLEPKYKKLYEDTVDATDEWLMYRPMVKDETWDILFPAKVLAHKDSDMDFEFEITHLTCFIGGMYGLGGKTFGREKDIETAKKLTDGCVWAYQLTGSGVMPENAHVLPCPTLEKCAFNETRWWAALDPQKEYHDSQVAEWDLKYGNRAQAPMSPREPEPAEDAKLASIDSGAGTLVKRGASEKFGSRVVEARVGEPVSPTTADDDKAAAKVISEQRSTPSREDDYIPDRPMTHEEYVQNRIELGDMPPGFVRVQSKNYILRPEAIESVWYMYRITGDPTWMDKGWRMFEATIAATRTDIANSAIRDVFDKHPRKSNEMESFWIAETLKYYYLLFSGPDVISLDEWVLNTEAHPFRRPT